MSQVNVELHENYTHEIIRDWEHNLVHAEMAAIGFLRTASTNNVEEHLPRACYFNPNGTWLEVEQAWKNIKRQLGREVSIEGGLPDLLYQLRSAKTGTRGAMYDARQEAYSGADREPAAAG
jgi:hypothetical protein